MSIVKPKNITPRNIRAIVPERYKNMEYVKLEKGDNVTLVNCVFSVFQAKDENGHGMVYQKGDKVGQPVTNCVCYLGLDDGHYTSVKNDIVDAQIGGLVGFDSNDAEIGYYSFDFAPEKVKVVGIDIKKGKGSNAKTYPSIAFENVD